MFNRSKAFLAAAVLLPASFATTDAMAATATGHSRAIIVTPTSFFLVEDMNFGTIVPGSSSGTVSIDAVSGLRTSGGGVAALAGGTVQRARFVAGGTEGEVATLSLSAPPVLDDGNGHTMPMSALTLDGPASRTFGPEQAIDIYVGGTLDVGANQAEGSYSGDFTLTVEYS